MRYYDCCTFFSGMLLHAVKPGGVVAIAALVILSTEHLSRADELYVGGASVSITPDGPVSLTGQMHTRIAREVESEVTVTALAIESRDGDRVLDQAIMVSCDLVGIRGGLLEETRERLRKQLPDFDVRKLVLNATHTHTAPTMTEGKYNLPSEGVMQPAEYVEFASQRIADAAATAWESRKLGGVGWGLGHAMVAYNRRGVYADGRSVMYGKTDANDFRGLEGYEDNGVEVLFFWTAEEELLATAINVASPSQTVEGRSLINADFWHPIRESLKAKYGQDLLVLGWTGAAGDQAPRPMFRKQAEERMLKLRGVTQLEELSRRVVAAWEDAYEAARQEIHTDAAFVHKVQTIELPRRKVTEAEFVAAKKKVVAHSRNPAQHRRQRWEQAVVDRYNRQQAGTEEPYRMELHAIRLGDVAIATNDFELFTDFGIQMKARSPALQTFVIQLCGPGTYIPTERAVRGGGYSAIVQSSEVGPNGGQVLTDQTIASIKRLFASSHVPAKAPAKAPNRIKNAAADARWKPLFNGENLDNWDLVIGQRGPTRLDDDPDRIFQVHDGMVAGGPGCLPTGAAQPWEVVGSRMPGGPAGTAGCRRHKMLHTLFTTSLGHPSTEGEDSCRCATRPTGRATQSR